MKTVLITGGNRGLGRALVTTFDAADWKVYATARNPDQLPLSDAKGSYDKGSNGIVPLTLDLANYESIDQLVKTLDDFKPSIDLLINNAGYNPKDNKEPGFFDSTFRIEHFSGANVGISMTINALAPTQLVSRLLPRLAKDAVVLNISSWLGSIGNKDMGGHYGYAGSKALLNMFTKAMALEFKDHNRSAVAVNPGWMKTDMGGDNAKHTPDETAAAILNLYENQTLHKNSGEFINTDGSQHPW